MKRKYPGSLHNHDEYSNIRLRDSIIKASDLINYAIELGHEVLAFTNHECVSNAIKVQGLYQKIKKDHPDFKIILGNEIYLCRNGLTDETYDKDTDKFYHFILLAKDEVGHQQIREISTRAWLRSWKNGKMRRVPTYYQDLIDIIGANPGHVIGSTACLGGALPTQILKLRETNDIILQQNIYSWVKSMMNLFGEDNFYLELQPSNNEEQIYVNRELINISDRYKLPYIITTDTHYLKKEDAPIHKAYLRSQEGDREVDNFYATTYLMGTEELESYLQLTEEELEYAYDNIRKIKDSCEDYDLRKPLKIPELSWKSCGLKPKDIPEIYTQRIPELTNFINSEYEGDKLLACFVMERVLNDETLQNEKTWEAINECLEMTRISSEVNKAHWSAYYLNLQKIIDVCWDAGSIVGPGRGSGVGFILLYLLGITQINPLRETTPTFAWRFLNPERVSVLDVDFDIEGGRRAQVLNKFREVYGEDRVAGVITFGTEKSKQAILTAARGLGIEVDEAQYIASLVPADRGQTRTLKQCYYGDKENDYAPVALFIQQMEKYPELWQVAQKIEGLVCRCGIHAGGIIFVDEPFTNSTGLMRAPDGTIITAYDLHDAESVSLIKYDALSVEAMDKIHTCLDLLCEAGHVEKCDTLKETYENAIGIYNLEREAPEMWEMVHKHKILSLFQMEQQSGIQGIALSKPNSVDDLATLNSVIRLMAQEKGAEQPLSKFARFKKNIDLWYDEMNSYNLTQEEQRILEPILLSSYGICESQEKFMQLVQIPECGGFTLTWADRLRKSIAKKNPAEYEVLTQEYLANVSEKNLSKNLCNYVWNSLVATSRGYGFNASHTLAYSLIALQEMNLAYKYPIIYWNCACLITDSGSTEHLDDEDYDDDEDQSTNYDKIAKAISIMKDAGVEVSLVNINESDYSFKPDEVNNKIWFGLKGLLNISDDFVEEIIKNRPYTSIKDFYLRVNPNKKSMISLIKGGAFDEMIDRKIAMAWYLWETCDKKSKLNLQNMATLIKYNLIPQEEKYIQGLRVYEFNRFLKAICNTNKNGNYFILNERAINFLMATNREEYIHSGSNNEFLLDKKAWDKAYQAEMDVFRDWIKNNQAEILKSLNEIIFLEAWNKYAAGTISAWEMEVVCFYYHDHELAHVNKELYGIKNFKDLPRQPEIERSFVKAGKVINLYKLNKICGTCVAKNKNKSIVTLLTPDGVVDVKFRKDYFSLFDKQISEIGEDGKKHIAEKSWFNRGSMILVMGIRQGDSFIPKKYASSNGHQLYRIETIDEKGELILQDARLKGE